MFYSGRTEDGSDMRESQGMYTSPCGNFWGSEPYTDEQKAHAKEYNYHTRMHNNIHDHLGGCRSFQKEYELVKQNKSTLPKSLREYLINWIEND